MRCEALTNPAFLARLIQDLDGMTMNEYNSAFTCVGPSIEDPGRNRLWIIPKDTRAGANPSLWLKQNHALLQKELAEFVAYCTVIFPGDLPAEVQHEYVRVRTESSEARNVSTRRGSNSVWKEVRCISAAGHLYVDRLRLHTSVGNVDHGQRENLVTLVATRFWDDEKERVYVHPNLKAVKGGPGRSVDERELLLQKRPSCSERGLTVLYGPGGIGKTFFLNRLANKIGIQTKSDVLASIPVFIHPPALLHKQALETWLAQYGFGKLTLAQITTFIRYGIIIPLLDALDEVVKGEARQGSQEFLHHLVELTSSREVYGRGVLACRDYYLNSDRLVPDIVREPKDYPAAELSFGCFNKKERRSFLQVRAKLDPSHASRWATALESQTTEVLGREATKEIEELIGHPVVLDTLARYIQDLPPAQRITLADEFKITSSDIFGQIIDQLLKRERDKLIPSWKQSFQGRLKSNWHDPLDLQKQKKVLQALTLLVASDGAVKTELKASENDIYRTLRHGVFMYTKGIRRPANKREAMQQIIRSALGTPEVIESVPSSEHDSIIDEALGYLAEAYLGHILADTEPGLPDDLIFAFRHRTYFDYLLADALIARLEDAIRTKKAENFMQWCQIHHIFETFGTCLDFILWDPRVNGRGMEQVHEFIDKAQISDDILASYVISLALTLFLRRGRHLEGVSIEGFSFAPYAKWDLLLIREMLTPSISGLRMRDCSFPRLTVDGIDFRDVVVESCDFEMLCIMTSNFYDCSVIGVECNELRLGGTVNFQQSKLELEECSVIVEEGANIEFHNCEVSFHVLEALEESKLMGLNITLDRVTAIQPPPVPFTPLSNGRRFLNKLMALACRGGRKQFSIYEYKLRDRTPGTDEQFVTALACLENHGCIERRLTWIVLTPKATEHMYSFHPEEEPRYERHKEFWDPITEELDKILG